MTQDTLAQQAILSKAASTLLDAEGKMKKAIAIGTGLFGINLAEPASQLVPLLSPSYNMIPRRVIDNANSHQWKDILALGSPNPFRGATPAFGGSAYVPAAFSTQGNLTTPRVVSFVPFALFGQVDQEAQQASRGFDPALAKETSNCLLIALKLMWQSYLFANITDISGAPAAPTVALGTGAGSLNPSSTTYFARIVAVMGLAMNRAPYDIPAFTDANGEGALAGRAVPQSDVQAMALAATAVDGCGLTAISAEGNSGSQTGSNKSLKITWSAVAGAIGYIVFVGTTTGAANLKAECIVGQTQVTLTSLAGTGVAGNDAAIPSANFTGDANSFDGLAPQLLASGSSVTPGSWVPGAYVKNVNNALSGSSTVREVTEFQDAFSSIYARTKCSKFKILTGGAVSRSLTNKGIVSSSMQIFANPTPEGRMSMVAGAHVGEVLNSITGDRIPIEVDPWIPPGCAFIIPTEIPFPSANLAGFAEWVGNYDFMRFDYAATPSTGPVFPFEQRCNGALALKFSGGCGFLYNIWA